MCLGMNADRLDVDALYGFVWSGDGTRSFAYAYNKRMFVANTDVERSSVESVGISDGTCSFA